jgi:hypothetical protein
MVPSLGTRRRIGALVALGYTYAAIGERAGVTLSAVYRTLQRPSTIRREVAERYAAIYDELCMTPPPRDTRQQKRDYAYAQTVARRNNWLPPLAWVDIDDPNEQPNLSAKDHGVDHVVVDRLLSGDFSVTANRAEREEVVRRWSGTDNELERRTGWNVARIRRGMNRPTQEVA